MITVKIPSGGSYDILMEQSFAQFAAALQERCDVHNRKLCIVSDSNVSALYGQTLLEELQGHCGEVTLFTFPAGEENKNLDTVQSVYEHLIRNHVDRKGLLIALGGGVTGDLTGFVAATYLRGIDFVQVPTTLLSQVDSSIGGKTGVDFKAYKNMVGAFYMPKMVYMNLAVLKTLPPRQFSSGMAEILKHGLIKDAKYYTWLITHFEEICDLDMAFLERMITDSCKIKAAVVENDPTEQGERALLNFGHTLGHAIEKQLEFQLTHGECVALGCVAAAFLSWKREYISEEEYYEIRDMFVPFGLPISQQDLAIEEVIRHTKSDKKNELGKLKFILLDKVGKAAIYKDVTEDEMRLALQEINYMGESDE